MPEAPLCKYNHISQLYYVNLATVDKYSIIGFSSLSDGFPAPLQQVILNSLKVSSLVFGFFLVHAIPHWFIKSFYWLWGESSFWSSGPKELLILTNFGTIASVSYIGKLNLFWVQDTHKVGSLSLLYALNVGNSSGKELLFEGEHYCSVCCT